MPLRHAQKREQCFYWIVCSTGIFKKVYLALVTYQNIIWVRPVNCPTYFWHVPKLRQYLCLRVFSFVIYRKCNSNWLVFFSFFVQVCKLWHFWHFEICGQCLNITGYFALHYIVWFLSTAATFCCSRNCMSWISLNYKTYFRHAQLLKHYLYLVPFNMFSYEQRKFNSNY